MKNLLLVMGLCGLAWARPGLTPSEARALSQQGLTYREMCRKPEDQVREQLAVRPEQFELTDLQAQAGNWLSGRQPGRALFRLPAAFRGRVMQVNLDATFIQGQACFFTGDDQATPAEELLTFHVPAWSSGCEHFVSHHVRVVGAQTLLFSLPPQSQMRIRRLVLQALN